MTDSSANDHREGAALGDNKSATTTTTTTGRTLLQQAVILDDQGLISALLEHGADVQAQDGNSRTPLHIAAALGHESSAHILLSKGAAATISTTDCKGLTPMHLAVQNGRISLVKLLTRFGADVNLRF